ncbi:MAG: hypothetical protein COX37_01385 [Candidatus Nealsonbacteria bacterium CG23_combo_of_CG06-09_8_20_14_all_39_17]|uniref:PDZ domain-containing protein n=1 Tax=Candidatus Nealsonbacteria bacterium CG23_combo_of_CG06-09_8_20_14_all_39_17 TaxID=1974722 RepID=A0A2G9YUK0_9BACT|nr:MAG: hypothetical protein COX37_01385 [Candidatus Nealsonbacteria bacterium CG23_combo_of_CG06-09_8_20_14_all_39_17]
MSLYDLPEINTSKIKENKLKLEDFLKNKSILFIIFVFILSSAFGFIAGVISNDYLSSDIRQKLAQLNAKFPELQDNIGKGIAEEYQPQTSQEEKIIQAVKSVSPAVVSIIISKDVPIMEQRFVNPFGDIEQLFGQPFGFSIPEYYQKGTEKKEVGGGTGFIVSEDGMILTNKHVVSDEKAEYTVFTNDGKKFLAKVLARDQVQDIAIIQVVQGENIKFPTVQLGDSENLQIGQSVIAIGNALGEFKNTVSVGVVSGLGRTITASGGDEVAETLEGIIQTDAAINRGNSGGPLLNLKGDVIGMNTAVVSGAQSLGFTIPINKAKRDIEQIKTLGKLAYPFIGIRYVLIDEEIQKERNLAVDYGAWITSWYRQSSQWVQSKDQAVVSGSAAAQAGLKENDIVLEFDKDKVTKDNSLGKIIDKYNPGDKVVLKVLRGKEEKTFEIILGDRPSQ